MRSIVPVLVIAAIPLPLAYALRTVTGDLLSALILILTLFVTAIAMVIVPIACRMSPRG